MYAKFSFLTILFSVLMMNNSAQANPLPLFVDDPHSCAKPEEAVIEHLQLQLDIDFQKKRIKGQAQYTIKTAMAANAFWLDTRGLEIIEVSLGEGQSTSYELMAEQPFLGRPLKINITPNTRVVNVRYQTTDEPGALQWLSQEQTQGGQLPFLFTQGQAVLSRTWMPVQDSPGIRFSWDATVKVPADFMALMSGTNPQEKNPEGSFSFRMDLPVPAYLIALAVGDLAFKPLGERCGVYAEPAMLERAASEFVDTEKMLIAAEKLYGTYQWGRYDLLVLPPSFPFGGMENPRLTFATPTIIAGDRSLTSLVAHELAHSWSGNLVTNATWNDFWLNEGFTVYFERRIMEALYGKDYAEMLAELGYQDVMKTIAGMGKDSQDTRLKLDLKGRDPDDGMNDIAYEKGYFLLCSIENLVGRAAFDDFLRKYFKEFAFKTIDTEQFVKYITRKLPAINSLQPALTQWIYQTGMPEHVKPPVSQRFRQTEQQLTDLLSGKMKLADLKTVEWTTHEWVHFIRHLPDTMDLSLAEQLDGAFKLSNATNAEIQAAWFEKLLPTSYTAINKPLDEFLVKVGRRKFVLPLFKGMAQNPARIDAAREIYRKARPGYHAVTAGSVDALFAQ